MRFLFSLIALAALLSPFARTASAATVSHTLELKDEATFKAMSTAPGGVVRVGRVMKFLVDNRKYPDGKVYFINGNHCEGRDCPVKWVALHYDFAEKRLPNFHVEKRAFEDSVYYQSDADKKQFIAGRVQTFEVERDGKRETFYGIWFFERDIIREEAIQYTMDLIRKAIRIPNAKLGFVQYSQEQTVEKVRPWFEKNNIGIYSVEEVLANMTVLPLNPGEAFGYLRVNPADPDDLEPTEIPMFDQLPLDLAVVAGTISTAFQDVGSHVNLKSKERGTPNVVVRLKDHIEYLKSLDGQPVRLEVTATTYKVERSTAAQVQRAYEAKVNRPWQHATTDLTGDPLHFDHMCRRKSPAVCLGLGARFGGKASRLGFLAHEKVIGYGSEARKKYGYRLSPLGFGVPLRYYREFVDFNTAKNPEFKADLERLINSESNEGGLSPLPTPEKKALIEKVRAHFLAAQFSPEMYASLERMVTELKAHVAETYPGEDLNKLKIRSSANVEDIEGFNGAGLHDSFSASIKKSSLESANGACTIVPDDDEESEGKVDMKPKSLGCAIKGTFASLWNLRAVRERSYRRFHHRSAIMALAILPAYKFRKVEPEPEIAANSVLLTRVLNTTAVYGYQLSSQVGNGLVTNPAPGSQAELSTMVFQLRSEPAISVLRFAKPRADQPALKTSVIPVPKMRDITYLARRIEEVYCENDPKYFPGRKCTEVSNSAKKPFSLDMELKVFSNGEILMKQFRLFSGK